MVNLVDDQLPALVPDKACDGSQRCVIEERAGGVGWRSEERPCRALMPVLFEVGERRLEVVLGVVLTASSFRRNLASTVLQRSPQVGFFDFQ